MKRSFTIVALGLLEVLLWCPNLLSPPWDWYGRRFDLGSAIDFVPAVAMVVAGVLSVLVGVHKVPAQRTLRQAIWANVGAIVVVGVALVVGGVSGAALWSPHAWANAVSLSVDFALPGTAAILLGRRSRLASV